MQNRNRTFRIQSLVFTVIFVIILLLGNLVITKISDKFPLKFDVTSDNRFSLSDESKNILKNLEKDVTIYLIESGKYPMDPTVVEVIDLYRKYAEGHINVVSKDIVTDYAFATKYGGNLSYGSVIFECGEIYKTEYYSNLISKDDLVYTIENTITNNIIYVSSDANSLVYITKGHNEDESGAVTTALNSENYTYKYIDLLKEDIPSNVALLTVYGPKKDFDPTEIAKLNSFLTKGGSVQIYLDPDTTKLSNLYRFAEDWGIIITDNYIVEKDSSRIDVLSSNLMHPFITEYAFSEDVFDENATVVLSNVHSLSYEGSNPKGAQNVIAMLYTSKNASSRAIADSKTVSEGEQYLAVLSTKFDDNNKESNLYVVGTTDLFNTTFFEEGSRYSNRDFYLKSIGWMCGFKESIKISSKRAHSDILGISKADGVKYTLIIFAVSVLILAMGIVVWARRRYL